jgi:POT family proton-dependent oligopeptide transporter
LGRFKTICVAVVIALLGHIILIIPALPGVIEHQSAIGAFVVALIIMGIGKGVKTQKYVAQDSAGTGLFKANISPLVAEQYRGDRPFIRVTKNGERVIVDPTVTISSIYMVRFPIFLFQV